MNICKCGDTIGLFGVVKSENLNGSRTLETPYQEATRRLDFYSALCFQIHKMEDKMISETERTVISCPALCHRQSRDNHWPNYIYRLRPPTDFLSRIKKNGIQHVPRELQAIVIRISEFRMGDRVSKPTETIDCNCDAWTYIDMHTCNQPFNPGDHS